MGGERHSCGKEDETTYKTPKLRSHRDASVFENQLTVNQPESTWNSTFKAN